MKVEEKRPCSVLTTQEIRRPNRNRIFFSLSVSRFAFDTKCNCECMRRMHSVTLLHITLNKQNQSTKTESKCTRMASPWRQLCGMWQRTEYNSRKWQRKKRHEIMYEPSASGIYTFQHLNRQTHTRHNYIVSSLSQYKRALCSVCAHGMAAQYDKISHKIRRIFVQMCWQTRVNLKPNLSFYVSFILVLRCLLSVLFSRNM